MGAHAAVLVCVRACAAVFRLFLFPFRCAHAGTRIIRHAAAEGGGGRG